MLVPRFLSPIWLCALQTLLSNPQQEMTPVALLIFCKIFWLFFHIQHSIGWISKFFSVKTLPGSCLCLRRINGRTWHIENNCYLCLRFEISTCDAAVIRKCRIYQGKLFFFLLVRLSFLGRHVPKIWTRWLVFVMEIMCEWEKCQMQPDCAAPVCQVTCISSKDRTFTVKLWRRQKNKACHVIEFLKGVKIWGFFRSHFGLLFIFTDVLIRRDLESFIKKM